MRNCYGCGDIYYCSKIARNIMYHMYITKRRLHLRRLGENKMTFVQFLKNDLFDVMELFLFGDNFVSVSLFSNLHCFVLFFVSSITE